MWLGKALKWYWALLIVFNTIRVNGQKLLTLFFIGNFMTTFNVLTSVTDPSVVYTFPYTMTMPDSLGSCGLFGTGYTCTLDQSALNPAFDEAFTYALDGTMSCVGSSCPPPDPSNFDASVILADVDFSTLIFAILAIGALLVAVRIVFKSSHKLLQLIKAK